MSATDRRPVACPRRFPYDRRVSAVTVRVPAKVNLWLSVGPPGRDGYHELVSVFQAVSLFDELTARPAAGWAVDLADPLAQVPTAQDNLALQAAQLLADQTGAGQGAWLTIRKSIPVAGGMAGGSADAAAALVACDALWGTGLSRGELLRLAARLGADVAFPLVGGTAVGAGRGEQLHPLTPDPPETEPLHWVFAFDHRGLTARAVYAECDRLRAETGQPVTGPHGARELTAALRTGDAAAVGAAMHNDLQPAALSLRPGLRHTLDVGRACGALGAVVCGSGPTCAFLARSAAHAGELRSGLEETRPPEAARAQGVCRPARQAYGPVPGATVAGPRCGGTREG